MQDRVARDLLEGKSQGKRGHRNRLLGDKRRDGRHFFSAASERFSLGGLPPLWSLYWSLGRDLTSEAGGLGVPLACRRGATAPERAEQVRAPEPGTGQT